MLNLLLEIGATDKSFWDYSFKIGDVILLFLLSFGAYQGYLKGIVVELLSLFLLIFIIYWVMTGTYLGFSTLDQNDMVGKFSKTTTPFLTFLIITILLSLLMEFLGNLGRKFLKFTLFGSADSFIGGIFSLIKYCFVVGLVMTLCIDIGLFGEGEIREKSLLMPLVMDIFHYIVIVLDGIGVDIYKLLIGIQSLLER
ncbi:Colicin V production protein [Bernardetia litoralis DSM 6794]|uniref:Colicin V production protein n=1 Tax=Bernardetia litoralis (strain ATCC 23117 / DSM 6794 / NBRC 15988 / NCIMB 1366 / Fx l1 / Sio-4) TaxID=880071 RepID=I4APU5_BERLS|nr:CvpA family protein [Bernardetia litoralis]AFM05980.1 Colicin V production protein [Bernardetia litoralis DSM 6794]